MRQVDHWIGGRRTQGSPKTMFEVTDPVAGSVVATVPMASPGDVDDAVGAARTAWAGWREASLSSRAAVMFAFRELLEEHRLELAEMVSAEHGKVREDALGEMRRGIEVVEFACGVGQLLKGERTDDISTEHDAYTVRQPVGVVAGITPFNFPAMVPMWMYPVAIACGNCFVLKPSEKDPSVAVRIGELFAEAGLPDGVFNVLHGDADAVNGLCEHPGVDAVSFVGSTPIARHVHRTASMAGKRVQALGGAKNHMIVLPDADIGQAADAAVSAGYGSAGERCMAISVVVAVGAIADDLSNAICDRIDALRIGPGLGAESVDMGPLVTAEHRDRVLSYIDLGESEGAVVQRDGRELVVDGHPDGYWVGPTLLDEVTTEMKVYEDEIFGPVLCLVRVETFEEAMELIENCQFGNGVALFTRDGGAARRFRREAPVGMVGVNVAIPVPMAYHPFGGWKDSLFGDHHMHGPEGIRFYTRLKAVTEHWPDPADRGVDLGFPTAR
ncbi:MAG: CoA-acylating methylmalonate-semialdehyde dehydrogenase [Acidimicrobiales bacterium]|nr:CoA-acylating methylmalonate-semialdehyde dehydrogenase [Acidimicrobiales bacterium]MYG89083.1 CoA-acylating methylmalonate-semialdehyde dehydrogenase [Acidimicrobiales bacterium]MYI28749.1 CoA-acylating methylmalonate-semialdehyde dehydrogenase [Acidimicrobiales bacterium]